MDEQIATFSAFTSATPAQAQQYLSLTDGNVEQAVELFFSNPDLGATAAAPSRPVQQTSNRADPITIDDDEGDDYDDEVEMTGSRPAAPPGGASVEDDEAMARRLQEEMYGAGGGGGGGGDIDPETGVRAPMARTTETLVGPDSDWRGHPGQMNAALFDQLQQRQMPGRGRFPNAGIFNQGEAPSIWAEGNADNPEAQAALARATGGASTQGVKSNLLAQLFQPPFDLIAKMAWSEARDEGKESEKWILVNVQDPSIFDCQVLNRDIWKNPQIRDTIKEHFIFLQYNKDDPRGREYIQYYFANMRDSEDAYPHIAIVDPRTGEQVKTWSGSPGPKPSDFLMDLHEFLDRYSLSMEKKNPVQAKRKERKKDPSQMTEEEMLEMAMQNSLDKDAGASKDEDPDALTKASETTAVNGKGKSRLDTSEAMDTADMGPSTGSNGTTRPSTSAALSSEQDTPFSRIPATNTHEEPTSTGPDTTRIQFRYSGGRVVRRFALSDSVSRIYEWLKASPLAGKDDKDFELISMGKNLIASLDVPISEAGLKNGTVMVEFVDDDDE
ncbi:hypothetical protein LTR36_009646 [Oleoguttula mirabilis]|uniref:UBX domain-containing protein n=1 Tax=Oleoguttula mirabilis TaxID=1507867 RepID=A0AAV9J6D5_9PEZI|nr:hypothetical protein LTR36_009646 [Oleoguttula mirabilis]